MIMLAQPSSMTPFTLLFVEKLDPNSYLEVIEASNHVVESYNPETQTSDFSIYGGTQMSYDLTYCGVGFGTKKDDQEISDD